MMRVRVGERRADKIELSFGARRQLFSAGHSSSSSSSSSFACVDSSAALPPVNLLRRFRAQAAQSVSGGAPTRSSCTAAIC